LGQIIAEGEYYGMQTFDQHLLELIKSDVVDVPTALGAASNPHDLRVQLMRSGTQTA
jgi:twitching motility protein PilT